MNRTALLLTALCTALTALPARSGDLVAYEGGDLIRLSEAACTNEAVLNRIEPDARRHFRTASAVVQGQTYQACWGALPTAVYLIYEDGDQGVLPMSRLQVPVDI
ncbi:hypothetical protein V4F39_22155 [Aquincola sp. MAHUQ-54]|uniref:Uncharacterized protein n=1 Tax=Aquincola agrisoli TaxID=3119538 RepID=A0AAW9Q9H4_9BURK